MEHTHNPISISGFDLMNLFYLDIISGLNMWVGMR